MRKISRLHQFSFIALFLLTASLGFAQSFEEGLEIFPQQIRLSEDDLILMEGRLQVALEKDPGLTEKAPSVAAEMADLYLKNQSVQEAIWALDRGGLYAEADELARRYESFLQTAAIVRVESIGEGVTLAKLVTFENGMKAVLKPRDRAARGSIEAELWTYEFDRLVGFNLVPAAVKRKINGIEYSLHGFVTGARTSGIHMSMIGDKRFPDLSLLDYLIANVDRHEKNSMWTQGERLFAIDHGKVGSVELFTRFSARMKPSARLLQNLAALIERKSFAEFCRKYSPVLDMSFVIRQIRILKIPNAGLDGSAAGSSMTRSTRHRSDDSSEPTKYAPGLGERQLSLWIDGRVQIESALMSRQWSRIEKLVLQSRSNPAFEKIITAEWIEASNWIYEKHQSDVAVPMLQWLLRNEDMLSTFAGSRHEWQLSLVMNRARGNRQFRARVLEKMQSVQGDRLEATVWSAYHKVFSPSSGGARLCRQAQRPGA